MVPKTGLEPALISQPDPKSGASTNSATSAVMCRRGLRFAAFGFLQSDFLFIEIYLVFRLGQSQNQPTGEKNDDEGRQADFEVQADPREEVPLLQGA